MILIWVNNKNNNLMIKDMKFNSIENCKYVEVELNEGTDIVNVFDWESI